MYCKNCGRLIDDNAKCCPKCGALVDSAQPTGFEWVEDHVDPYQQGAKWGISSAPQSTKPDVKAEPATTAAPAAPAECSNKYGVAGFVVALISLFVGGVVWNVIGLIFSVFGVRRKSECTKYNALATAGLVISIIALVLWVALIIFGGISIPTLLGAE